MQDGAHHVYHAIGDGLFERVELGLRLAEKDVEIEELRSQVALLTQRMDGLTATH